MKLPFINVYIASGKTVEAQHEKIEAYETILSGAMPELEQVALALHELKCGGSAYARRLRGRALDRKILKLSKAIDVIFGGEDAVE